MQANANELDSDRVKRLAALAAREREEAAAEEAARMRNNRFGGGRAQFLNAAHRQAGELGLAVWVGGGRQGMVRQEE